MVSASALQWLTTATQLEQSFRGLRQCWAEAGPQRAVLQWYPADPAHASRAVAAAETVGLAARLVIAFPLALRKRAQVFSVCLAPCVVRRRRVWCPAAVPVHSEPGPLTRPARCAGAGGEATAPRGGVGGVSEGGGKEDDAKLVELHCALANKLVRLQRRVTAQLPSQPSAPDRAMLDTGVALRLVGIAGAAGISGTASEVGGEGCDALG